MGVDLVHQLNSSYGMENSGVCPGQINQSKLAKRAEGPKGEGEASMEGNHMAEG